MAYVISDACISCGACEGTCPAGAISEGDGQYVIDADTCMECGACADGCPAGAISRNNFQVRILFKQQKRDAFLCISFLFHIFSYLFRCWQGFYRTFCCNG